MGDQEAKDRAHCDHEYPCVECDDPLCPEFPHKPLPALTCEVIAECKLWDAKAQGCGYFTVGDEPNDEDCRAAHHLNANGLLGRR